MIAGLGLTAARCAGLAATRMGDLAAARLAPLPERGEAGQGAWPVHAICGRVESVYLNAVNVVFAGESSSEEGREGSAAPAWAISLLREGTPLNPYAVTVSEEVWEGAGEAARSDGGSAAAFLGARPCEAVFLSRDTIEPGTGRLSISLSGARVWDSRLRPPAAGGGLEAPEAEQIREELWRVAVAAMAARPATSHFLVAVMGPSGVHADCEHGASSVMAEATRRRLAAITSALADGSSAGLEVQLRRLIGFGEGLTPSGDDFFVGLLAASCFRPAGGRPPLAGTFEQTLPALAATTTRESQRMLEAACAGHYPEPVVELLAAAAGNDQDGGRLWARCLIEIGGSSGQDMLAGMLFSMTGGREHGQERKSLPGWAAGGVS